MASNAAFPGGEEGQETTSTEKLLERLVETFRWGCVALETPSENRDATLTQTINMAIGQMKQLAEQTRITDSDGLFFMLPHPYTHGTDHPRCMRINRLFCYHFC